jgi:hypothetical protein
MTSCSTCGGDASREWPKHATGCQCAARAVIDRQRGYVAEKAAAGSMSETESSAYLRANRWPEPEGG